MNITAIVIAGVWCTFGIFAFAGGANGWGAFFMTVGIIASTLVSTQ
jgi:hypothetical protein